MTTKPQPANCPTCGSNVPLLRNYVDLIYGLSAERCHDSWHSQAGQTPEQGGPCSHQGVIAKGGGHCEECAAFIRFVDSFAAPSPEKAGAEPMTPTEWMKKNMPGVGHNTTTMRDYAAYVAAHSTQALREELDTCQIIIKNYGKQVRILNARIVKLEQERDVHSRARIHETILNDHLVIDRDKCLERAEQAERTVAELRERISEWEKDYQDNPRCFCPDCRADLGNFYSNRITFVRDTGTFVAENPNA